MRNQKFTLFILFVLCIFNMSTAQQCAFDGIRQQQLQDPNYVELEKAAEKRIQDVIKNRDLSKMDGSVLTIPVVIHVLHLGETIGTGTNISDAQIQSSIDNLNDYYRGQISTSPVDFEIEFILAQRDPNCNATTGINRIDASGIPNYSASGVALDVGPGIEPGADETILKDLSRWPETDYFNIWIVTEINNNGGGSGIQGYANFHYGNAYEGSVMMYTVFGYDPFNANPAWPLNFSRDNSTVVHEAGHYFHLYHTFQGDNGGSDCPADTIVGGINGNSDGCADTVPHRRETSTCPANNSCTGNPWVDNNTINNIMSYYYCADRLTNDQKTRARAAMEGTSLVNSKGATPIDISYAAPTSVCSVNAATNLTNSAGIVNVELNGVTFNSNTTGGDGGNIDNSMNCNNYFEIDTAVSNTINIGLWVNYSQLGIWIDWNDDGDFDDDAELQHLSQDIPDYSNVPVNLSYPTTIPYGDYVRIRVVTELDDRYGLGLLNSSCYSSLVYGQSEDYTIFVKPQQGSTTYTYNNSWSPSNPIGISTSGDDIIIEAGTVTISANTDCNSLTVESGAALTVESGVTLTATTVDLNSTSERFSSLILDGTITGTVNYNRHTEQLGTNDLISAPVVGQTFGAFESANTNLAASGSLRAFAQYNTNTGAYQNYDVVSNASTIIDLGIGYRAATTDGTALTFTGTVRTNDVLDIPITDAAAGYAWNLIGNPYPSYIDFETFFSVNATEFASSGVFQAIYGYDGNASNGWTIWNLATIADANVTELIAPGQAFFVKSKVGGGLIDFTTDMRRSGTSDDFILGRQSISNVALCKLNLSSSTDNSSTQIYFIEGTSRGLDIGYDAGSYTGNVSEFSIFSNLVEDNAGLDMAIQTLPFNDFNNVVVPLGINAQAGIGLTIEIDDTSSLPSNINVYLEDNETNTWTLLNGGNYSFSPSSDLNGTGRFFIHYSSVTLSAENNEWNNLQIYNTSSPKEIVVKGILKENTTANLYDIQGRLVLSRQLEKSRISNSIDISNVSAGIYIAKIFNDNQVKTQKLVVK
ncbi:hypothetical protein FBALC1_09083 [Flavobacteriales bacterium ALC-1]|nr:hypothetical protein FBALC1_09083 [Flavobacteriales bacterium ALC-1]